MNTESNGDQLSGAMSNFNPFAQWMKGINGLTAGAQSPVFKEWERWLTGQMDRLIRNELFLGQMSKSLESSFMLKQQVDRWVDSSIKAMRLPGLKDIEDLHGRLDSLERRIDRLTDAVEGLERRVPKSEAPAAPTEKAPAKKTPARKAPVKKAPAKKAPANKAPAKTAGDALPTSRRASSKATASKAAPAAKPAEPTTSPTTVEGSTAKE